MKFSNCQSVVEHADSAAVGMRPTAVVVGWWVPGVDVVVVDKLGVGVDAAVVQWLLWVRRHALRPVSTVQWDRMIAVAVAAVVVAVVFVHTLRQVPSSKTAAAVSWQRSLRILPYYREEVGLNNAHSCSEDRTKELIGGVQ